MAQPKRPPPSLLLVAAFSRHDSAIQWSQTQVESHWGPIALASDLFEHDETSYYEASMGSSLLKKFFIVSGNFDPERLPKIKLQSNTWEAELAQTAAYSEQRPLNIDPGYLTLTKLVLASAKDRAHRLYMADGIYAEECLYFLENRWQSRPWTYPDYQRDDFHKFFTQARELLKKNFYAHL